MEYNELNKKAMGGTELMAHRIEKMLGPDLLSQVQIIHSRVRELDDTKKKILVLHDLAGDPEVQHLKNGGWQKFDMLVFVSHWQKQMYEIQLGVPPSAGVVLQNSIVPIEQHEKPNDKTTLIYYSTPHRGLNLLYPVYNKLYEEFGSSIELKVFSSFDLYGWPQRDEPYKELFDALENHPGIQYSKSVSNDAIREELKKSHIFAYPSTWSETSCLCLIEAMSAGLIPVHSSLAALPETSMGLSMMYDYVEDPNKHASTFYNALRTTIQNTNDPYMKQLTTLRKHSADAIYNTERQGMRWKALVNNLLM